MTDTVIPADDNTSQSPLPAFFYGGGETRPPGAAGSSASSSIPIDRRTLLGLVAGTGMLASVLFAGGVLIGASMFLSTPQEAAFATPPKEVLIAPDPKEDEDLSPASQAEMAVIDDAPQAAPGDEPAIGSEDLAQTRREVISTPAPPAPAPARLSDTQLAALPQADPIPPAEAIRPDTANAPASPAASAPPLPGPTRSGEIPLPPPVPLAKSTPFAVQIGAFRIRENADAALRGLVDKGLNPLVVRRTSNDGNVWFYLRVGAYEDRARAKAAADRLKQTSALNGFPVRAEPGEVVLE